jgi:hypothetical protein
MFGVLEGGKEQSNGRRGEGARGKKERKGWEWELELELKIVEGIN